MVAAYISPETCVEVKSPHNTWKKLYEKAQFYFEQSALEVWFCNEQGAMTFTNLDGPSSALWVGPNLSSAIGVVAADLHIG